MTTPLVDPDDTDVDDFSGDIGDFFLAAAGEVVRDYCGWSITPPETVTLTLDIGSEGLIVLPSTYVTAIESVTVADTVLDPADYLWTSPQPWIELCWRQCARQVTISFTHGYDSCPLPVKSVVLEVASTATETPGGNATQIAAPSYRILFEPNSQGSVLQPSHRERLGKYRIGGLS